MRKQPLDRARAVRAALYVRVSTDRQIDGNSLITQKAQLKRHCVTHGYEIVDVYIDAGFSGSNTKRPQLQRLLQDAAEGRMNLVLATRVDRVSRSMKDFLELISTLRDHGVGFTAIEQPFDTSDPSGVLAQSILGSFAQFERELLVERTKEGHLHRLKKGDWSCGPVAFGYRKEAGRLVEIPENASIVRRVFALFIELRSRRGVAVRFNDEGVKAPGGKLWSDSAVTSILRNPVYTGANVYGRHKKGDTRLRPREEWTVLPGMRKPMVEPETFQRVQEVLHETGSAGRKHATGRFPLSGKVRCSKCGAPMHGSTRHKGGKVYRYYKCSVNQRGGTAACSGTSIPAERLEENVRVNSTETIRAKPMPAETCMNKQTGDDVKARQERRKALDSVRQETRKLFELYEAGEIDRDDFQRRMVAMASPTCVPNLLTRGEA
jgi:site-specific DNA recombinase